MLFLHFFSKRRKNRFFKVIKNSRFLKSSWMFLKHFVCVDSVSVCFTRFVAALLYTIIHKSARDSSREWQFSPRGNHSFYDGHSCLYSTVRHRQFIADVRPGFTIPPFPYERALSLSLQIYQPVLIMPVVV